MPHRENRRNREDSREESFCQMVASFNVQNAVWLSDAPPGGARPLSRDAPPGRSRCKFTCNCPAALHLRDSIPGSCSRVGSWSPATSQKIATMLPVSLSAIGTFWPFSRGMLSLARLSLS